MPFPANAAVLLSVPGSAFAGALLASTQRSLRVEPQVLSLRATNGSDFDPFASEHYYGDLKCGVTVQVGSKDDKFLMCPEECPYYAQDLDDDLHCSFVCVKPEDCATRNPNRPIADIIEGHKTCRGPRVPDCSEYNLDGTDSCAKCQWGYDAGEDGFCHFRYMTVVWVFIAVFVAFTVFGLVWVIDCCIRPAVNEQGLKKGEKFRSLQKIRDHNDNLFPFDSNLCSRTDTHGKIGGPGMLLHFRLQVYIIVWAAVIGCVWLIMAATIDNALFILGTRRFGTPRENCILVAWGYETQQRLMWTKVTFLVIAYAITFLSSLIFAISQQDVFERMDNQEKTMKDFMAFLTGLPELKASDPDAERTVVKFLEEHGVEDVVGVSIAWNYKEKQDAVDAFLESEMLRRDERHQTAQYEKTGNEQDKWQVSEKRDYSDEWGGFRKMLYKLEKSGSALILGDDPPKVGTKDDVEAQRAMLGELVSSEDAFVVFKTEEARNLATNNDEGRDVGQWEVTGNTIRLDCLICEPDTVQWQNYGNSTFIARMFRLFQGFGLILLALFFWTTVFYAPYAYQVFCFNYENGAQPPWTLALAFCMVVVMGNAIMYQVCAISAEYIGFKTRDERESCYLILYVIACMFNVILDMVTTYYLSEYILDGLNFRTYHGVRFADVPTFTEKFETYAMQRMLAENTKAYSFPATFLIPFLLEPFVTVIVPYLIGKVLVRTHKEWVGRDAELWMAAWEFDMGRYGDLLLDMVLGILIFFFPGGYTLILFFGMAGSHAYIYFFDHARVLCTIPKCVYATIDVDWWSCWMMAPITAMMPMCLVFKANCQHYGFCMRGMPLIEAIWGAFILHTVVHTILLRYVVPMFKPELEAPNGLDEKTYAECAEEVPCNWFNSNPIHCIRSQLFYKDENYCALYMLGKQHLLHVNPELGQYYDKPEGKTEEYEDSFATLYHLASKKKPDATEEQSGE